MFQKRNRSGFSIDKSNTMSCWGLQLSLSGKGKKLLSRFAILPPRHNRGCKLLRHRPSHKARISSLNQLPAQRYRNHTRRSHQNKDLFVLRPKSHSHHRLSKNQRQPQAIPTQPHLRQGCRRRKSNKSKNFRVENTHPHLYVAHLPLHHGSVPLQKGSYLIHLMHETQQR